jgi:hypothetical protein
MMSKYTEILNQIKETCSYEWLSHSQRGVFEKIAGGLETHRLVNIYGDPGTGKTFLGWIFQKTLGFIYTNTIAEIPECEFVVFDDNPRFRREDTRLLRPVLSRKNINRMILLTRQQVQDDVPALHLQLDNDDIMQVCSNLFMKLDFQILEKGATESNLRDLIIRNIK